MMGHIKYALLGSMLFWAAFAAVAFGPVEAGNVHVVHKCVFKHLDKAHTKDAYVFLFNYCNKLHPFSAPL